MTGVSIKAASSITTLDTFKTSKVHELLNDKFESDELIQPNYKEYLPPASLRRASKMTKMGIATAMDCIKQTGQEDLGAIVVGTGLGCLEDTLKYLNVSITSGPDSLIPPISFIQSGHNSISGQIALMLKCKNYNMTHVQRGLSFEHSMIDGMLNVIEGKRNVLVGGVDEKITLIDELAVNLGLEEKVATQLSQGASFFMLDPSTKEGIEVVSIDIVDTVNWENQLTKVLTKAGTTLDELGKSFIGYGLCDAKSISMEYVSYTDFVGRYWSSSAFGFHLAHDYLIDNPEEKFSVVINFDDNEFTGITLLKRV
ncbi:MAG: beta-ketoacyl synthase chain length factor [Reichenbachiella sp.]